MSPQEIFEAVSAEYDVATAVSVVTLHAIQMSTKIKVSDLTAQGTGQFTKRFEQKAYEKALWRLSISEFDLVRKINEALHAFSVCQAMGPSGIGGCRVKTLKELVEKSSTLEVKTKEPQEII